VAVNDRIGCAVETVGQLADRGIVSRIASSEWTISATSGVENVPKLAREIGKDIRMTYVLYGDKRSGAFSVECALAEADAPYEFKLISLEKNEQKSPEFLALNPSGKMPALKLPTGEIVTESAGLLLTVADLHPQAKLLPPPGTPARAQCYRWLTFMASEIYPMVEIVDYPARFAPDAPDAMKARAVDRIRERISIVEKAIAEPWLLKTGFSAADIYAVMFSRWSIGKEWREKNLPKLLGLTKGVSERPKIAPVWARHFGR
jgi:GST-like protein